MKIIITKEDCEKMNVDRDGVKNDHGRQGLEIRIGNVLIHLEDESDGENLAKMIYERNGL